MLCHWTATHHHEKSVNHVAPHCQLKAGSGSVRMGRKEKNEAGTEAISASARTNGVVPSSNTHTTLTAGDDRDAVQPPVLEMGGGVSRGSQSMEGMLPGSISSCFSIFATPLPIKGAWRTRRVGNLQYQYEYLHQGLEASLNKENPFFLPIAVIFHN